MKFVYMKLIWEQEGRILLKRETQSCFLMETRERGNSKEMEGIILQSRKTEKNSHVNIV
jgi:hypothetical protein